MKITFELICLKYMTKINLRGKLRLLLRLRKNALKKSKEYLVAGNYFYNIAGNILYLESRIDDLKKILPTYSEYNYKEGKTKKISYRLNNKSPKFKGTVLIFAMAEKCGKVFDFQANKVISCFGKRKYYETSKAKRKKFEEKFFNANTTKCIYDDQEAILIEERLISNSFVPKDVFSDIVYIYCDYFTEVKLKKNTFIAQLNWFKKLYEINLSEEFHKELPVYTMHGDLWSGNILLSNNKYYFIDFEDVSECWFAYDIFAFIFNEIIVKKDDLMLKEYLSGCYDLLFEDLFKSVSETFKSEYRKQYLLFFLTLITYKRWRLNYERRVWVADIIEKYELNSK